MSTLLVGEDVHPSAHAIASTHIIEADIAVNLNQTDYNKWQRKKVPTKLRQPRSSSANPKTVNELVVAPGSEVRYNRNRQSAGHQRSTGPVCNHSHHRSKKVDHELHAEAQKKDSMREVKVLDLLIKSRLKALENYRAREEVLLLENAKLREEIEIQEKKVHDNVTHLLQKYERYRGAVSTLGSKFETEKSKAKEELNEAQEKSEREIAVLDLQVTDVESELEKQRQELSMLMGYKDREYPVRARHIEQLQLHIKNLRHQYKREHSELEIIISLEKDKYEEKQVTDLQGITEDATNHAIDTLPDGLKEIALQNITMRKEIEEHSAKKIAVEQLIPTLQKHIKELEIDPKTDVRRQMFPHLFKEVKKCTPDMEVVLDIPTHQLLPM